MGRIHLLCALGVAASLAAGCSGLNSAGQSGGNGGSASGITLTLTPSSATVTVSQSTAFQATVAGSTNTAVTWQVNSVVGGNSTVGTITGGVYTAPAAVPTPATVTVAAVAQASSSATQNATVLVVAANPNQQAQTIPIKLGTSGGNANDSSTQGNLIYCCGGTLGSLVQRNGTYYILSNNHVLARSDSASIGDAIIQPGLIDANCSQTGTTTVANLTQYVNLEATGTNVDAALAQIVSGTVDTSGNILWLGGTATGGAPDAGPPHAGSGITASIGEGVAKSGRSSSLTCSLPSAGQGIDATELTTSVSYQKGCNTGASFSVTYTGQISVAGGTFSAEGDSGSLIVDANTADPVALLYGGSDTDSVGNPVADVLSALQDGQGNQPTFVGSPATHSVIGCTLAANAVQTAPAQSIVAVSAAQITAAQHARDMNAPQLLSNPYIQAVGVGASIDHPGEAAVILLVDPTQPATAIPAQLDGVATRIVRGNSTAPHGVFDTQTAARVAPVTSVSAVNTISKAELARAEVVNKAHANSLMKQPGVQGVGITSSADAPSEAALMIFVIRGVPRNPLPVVIDGLRTRIRESSRFTAGNRGNEAPSGCRVPEVEPTPTAKPQE
jgi:hypothetical protein